VQKARGGAHAVSLFIMGFAGDSFTSKDLLEVTGLARNNLTLALAHPLVKRAMADGGWSCTPGKGRAPSRFERMLLAVAAE
jgi:hypothetical protein